MTRWAMVADLRRCVGCQTCTSSCKHTNATPPSVQWRRVLDFEMGSYPNVKRTFVPVGCMHCADPPCMHVCPSTATGQREDGIVTIDYDICIGCAYCAVACPYQARYKVDKPVFAYGKKKGMKNEAYREDPARIGVAQKCTFCSDRVDFGLENGLTPGVDHEATPACVNSCIAGALHFGDLEDDTSNVSSLLAENQTFRMHEDVGTNSGFHYIWAKKSETDAPDDKLELLTELSRGVGDVGGAEPWVQQHWDWRAAGNFIGGGTGTGMLLATSLVAVLGAPIVPMALLGLLFIAAGLFLVWLETGRPLRAPLNVFFNRKTSWMTRESLVAGALLPIGLLAVWLNMTWLLIVATFVGMGFLYCQGQILKAAKGIPAWRQPQIVFLIIATGLAEGCGLFTLSSLIIVPHVTMSLADVLSFIMLLFILIRTWAWTRYRHALSQGAPKGTLKSLRQFSPWMAILAHTVPALLILLSYLSPEYAEPTLGLAAFLIMLGGWMMKFTIITRASYNQGFSIDRAPDIGGGAGAGAKPGWVLK